jgi:hypothetical protein
MDVPRTIDDRGEVVGESAMLMAKLAISEYRAHHEGPLSVLRVRLQDDRDFASSR